MFHKPTVFILGAGASHPYGYPLSRELIHSILLMDDSQWAELYVRPEDYHRFQTDLRNSHQRSIDAFLEYRQEFLRVGKLAIARCIARFENGNTLLRRDWYSALFDKIAPKFEDISQNKLSIMTFNYDRSLEHFLFEATKARFGKTDEQVACALSRIQIFHIYGRLGRLPWQKPFDSELCEARPYGVQDIGAVCNAAEGIKLIQERKQRDSLADPVHHTLLDAEWIFVIGFGFQAENMEWIKATTNKGLKVRATSFGFTNAEKASITSRFKIDFLDYSNLEANEFLRNDAAFLNEV